MEKRSVNNWFPILVWLSTVAVIGPIMTSIIVKFIQPDPYLFTNEISANFRIHIVFGILYSLPVFVVYLIVFKMLTNKNETQIKIKIYLTLLCLLGMYITFYIMNVLKNFLYTLPYPIGLTISTIIFRVYKENKKIITRG